MGRASRRRWGREWPGPLPRSERRISSLLHCDLCVLCGESSGEATMATGVDVLIRGARVVDGTGNPWRYGDVALAGDRVLDVAPPGSIPAESAREVVDGTGMVACPGFIDILS